jgi:signal peptide peptidase SppA
MASVREEERQASVEATARERARVLASPRRFRLRAGECLAMRPECIDFDWFFSGPTPTDRTESGIAIVSINGPLEHHSTWWWDSYADILQRVEEAMNGTDLPKAHERRNGWREDYEPIPAAPARAVILRIDSPGGEAAGATYAHRKLRALRRQYNVPLYSYADEMMCSAAYEIGCAADEIWQPDTGISGSVGVIATLFDRTAQNEKIGVNIELVTSGEFKADNHADRPLDDGIRGRMRAKVYDLANVFWQVVAEARGTTPKAVAALQAGTFVGQEAVDVGLLDGIAGWDSFLKTVEGALNNPGLQEAANSAA